MTDQTMPDVLDIRQWTATDPAMTPRVPRTGTEVSSLASNPIHRQPRSKEHYDLRRVKYSQAKAS